MNRHFIDYAALPCAPLGTPIRTSPPAPRDSEWKHLRPGYEVRTLSNGRPEIRTVNLPQKPATPDPLDALAERVVNDSDMYQRLRDHRGGCSCHISPPCGACSNPLTLAEAEELGWLEEPESATTSTQPPDHTPAGATHLQILGRDGGSLYEPFVGAMFYRAGANGMADFINVVTANQWRKSGWENKELDGPSFRRLAEPAATPH